MKKVIELERLAELVKDLKNVVQCHGVFDVIHLGHIRHLQAAKKFGDTLVVTVTPDRFVNKGPNRPLFNENLRAEVLAALDCVDYVVINKWATATNSILLLKPNVYVKGREYSEFDISGGITEESNAIESVGGYLGFTDDIVFSSSNLINKQCYSEETYSYLQSFSKKFPIKVIYDYINRMSEVKVLVIGETIVDEYQYGRSLGKSGKSPTVAFEVDKLETYDGGVGAIFNHLATFTDVSVLTDRRIIKKRYIENNQKLFETYKFEEPWKSEDEVCSDIECFADDYDVILVADFGHGMITKKVRDVIKSRSNLLVVNAQRNAGNMGHNTIGKYRDRETNIFFCIDKSELLLAVCDKYDNIDSITEVIAQEFNDNIIVTIGDGGCVVGGKTIPPFTTSVVDPLGAGDSFLSIITPLVYLNAPKELIGFIGNAAGALACGYVGNKEHVDKVMLCKFIDTILK